MSLHIQRFIDRVRAADGRQQRDVTLSITEARDLHADITRLLLTVENLRDQARSTQEPQTIEIEIKGQDF